MASIDIDQLRQWVGRCETHTDLVSATPLTALAATLDREDASGLVPPLGHWLSFLPIVPMAQVGPDGHPARGGFLPPVPLPRRMWAGSRLAFHQSIRVGDNVKRISEITDVQLKQGQGGALVFVKVKHAVMGQDSVAAITEEQDIVYRDDPRPDEKPAPPRPAPEQAAWRRTIQPDPVLLFRYSALTFNGHRIHYDRTYATGVEGYPGLVVHGPLIATLLVDLLRRHRPEATLTAFRFKGVRPLFDTASFEVCGQPADDGRSVSLWARDTGGALCMEATAELG